MLVAVFPKVSGLEQEAGQDVPSKKVPGEQLRHSEARGPSQVRQAELHGSHVFVAVFSKTLVATQAVGQVAPSRNLPVRQERHWLLEAPEHSPQLA